MKIKLAILAAAVLVAAAASVSQAQPYAIAGNFNGWNNTGALAGGPTVYTNIMTGGTPGNWEGCKVIAVPGSWNTTYPGNNLNISYDAGGSNTVYFYPGSFSDGWSPAQNRVGFEDPGNMTFEITGDFTSPNWGSDPLAQATLKAGSRGVYTNIYVIPTAGTHNFQFRTTGTWGNFTAGTDFGNNTGNAAVTTTVANQAVTFFLDLPNGRLQTTAPAPTCNVRFSVDMTLVALNDSGYDPTSVTINGGALLPGGWGGTACTNNPNAANTNVFTSPYFSLPIGSSAQYQFRYLSRGNIQYDALNGVGGQNRSLTVPNLASTNVPPVFWNDAQPSDVLNMDTTVYFTVNMTNAVGKTNGVVEHVFDPSAGDFVFINGLTGWLAWIPATLYSANVSLNENPPGSWIYTYSHVFPQGSSRAVTYKYSINGVDDEAAQNQNHFRYIRTTNGVAYLPMDTFGIQYVEPKVGGLTIGPVTGGKAPINWLPYPNVNLQSRTNLTAGTWQDVAGTMGGSSTNWPAGGSQFFRLIQH